jgi:hypothetical protein
VGSYPITYTISGSNVANYSVTSSAGTLAITIATPSISWSAPAPITYGVALSPVQLNATASVPGMFVYTPAAGLVLGAGMQTLSVSFVPSDVVDYKSASATVPLVVNKAGTVTTFALSNQNLTLTAGVASLGSGVPTGSVSFYEGQTLVGTATVSNGVASYTASSFPAGDVTVSAEYSGDANFTPSASPPILVLTVLPAATTLAVAQRGAVSDSLVTTVAPGYAGSVEFSCICLPSKATCTFQPSSVTFTGSNNSTAVTMTISTSALAHLESPRPLPAYRRTTLVAGLFWIPCLFGTMLPGRKLVFRARIQTMILLFLLCVLGSALTACGTSPSSSPTQTPAGSSTVQVIATGAAGLSQTTNVILTVQ